MASHSRRNDPLENVLSHPLEYALQRDDTFRHVITRKLDIPQYIRSMLMQDGTVRTTRLNVALRINGPNAVLPDEVGFPAYLGLPRTMSLYTVIDNWLLTFPFHSVSLHMHSIYQNEREGHPGDHLAAFLRLLLDHDLLLEHIVQRLTDRDFSQLRRWLEHEFSDALRLWEWFYGRYYAKLRSFMYKRTGSPSGEDWCWTKWLEYLQVPTDGGHHTAVPLAEVTAKSIGPIFSTAEYLLTARDPSRWQAFVETLPQAPSPLSPRSPRSPSSSHGSSSASRHSPPHSIPAPSGSVTRIPGRQYTFPIDQALLEPGALISSRQPPPTPTRKPSSPHHRHEVEQPTNSPRRSPTMVYVTNLEKEKESPYKPRQRSPECVQLLHSLQALLRKNETD
ncbi:hypothetical protein JCM11251_004486 [Rhodosporidiobolus azoricus]